ncbi:MAG: hypothetical protein ACE5JU_06965 [Candidatus Binatia bacterium]
MEREKSPEIERVLFTLLIVFLLLGTLKMAWEWELRASIIILVLGGGAFILALVQLASDLRLSHRRTPEAGGISFDAPVIQSQYRWGNIEIWAWLLGFYGGILLIGFLIAVPVFVFAYAKTYGARWVIALSLAVFAWGFIYGIFEYILHVPWPEPILF